MDFAGLRAVGFRITVPNEPPDDSPVEGEILTMGPNLCGTFLLEDGRTVPVTMNPPGSRFLDPAAVRARFPKRSEAASGPLGPALRVHSVGMVTDDVPALELEQGEHTIVLTGPMEAVQALAQQGILYESVLLVRAPS